LNFIDAYYWYRKNRINKDKFSSFANQVVLPHPALSKRRGLNAGFIYDFRSLYPSRLTLPSPKGEGSKSFFKNFLSSLQFLKGFTRILFIY
jgi:hypothetical protein